jgi:hypothetical protein
LPWRSCVRDCLLCRSDRKAFIPFRKHVPLSGKVIGVLVYDAQPVLSLEGRSGPANQFCLAYNGGSYRWVYVPVKENPLIGSLNIAVGDKGERKRFDNLSMANPQTLSQWDIKGKYALVEIDVNGGLGSPAADALVATHMRQLDGTKEFPFKLEELIEDLQKKYDQQLKDQVRQIDAAMEKAASEAINDGKATGPRERVQVMYVTWISETERLRIHFRTTIMDGNYKYAGGVNVDFGARTIASRPPVRATAMANPPLPNGLRQGKQFGIEFGTAFEISKTGKIEKTLSLPIESFQRDLQGPQLFNNGVGTRRGGPVPTATIRR